MTQAAIKQATVSLVLLTAVLLFPAPEAAARRLPADQLVEHLLSVADREWRDWGQPVVDTLDGSSRTRRVGARESDRAWLPEDGECTASLRRNRATGCHHAAPFDAHQRVRRYWAEGLGPDSKPARDPVELDRVARTQPWSAAFISFLMEQVGLSRDAFPFDGTHSNYMRGLAERAAAAPGQTPQPSDEAQFTVMLATETALAAGDLICGPRDISRDQDLLSLQRMQTLEDLQRLRASHCDLVVAVDGHRREARVIGGNVSNAVAMTLIPLTRDGRAIRTLSRAWFVVARPR